MGTNKNYQYDLSNRYYSIQSTRIVERQLVHHQKQLSLKLQTLRNYNTWSKTKVNRLNVDKILSKVTSVQKQPMFEVARTYGFRNNTNQVIKDHIDKFIINEEKIADDYQQNNFQKILDKKLSYINKNSHPQISFINFKKYNSEKEKIIIMSSPLKKQTVKGKIQPFKMVFSNKIRILPAELKQLKKRLTSLPSVNKKERSSLPNLTQDVHNKNPQFSEQISEELWQLSKIIKKQKDHSDKLYQEEVIEDIKAGVIDRFEIRLASMREQYKRNSKTYLKCIQGYKNDIKRQVIRANGIKRNKRLTLMQKIKKLSKEQEEAKQQEQN